MKSHLAPRILAVPLFIALAATPAIMQEGLISPWASWGIPLLAAASVFAVLAGAISGMWVAVDAGKVWRRERKAQVEDEADGAIDREAAVEDEAEPEREPDLALSEALSELGPENYMDLVRALQEMERHDDALEVLARVTEMMAGDYGEEIARALRRMRRQLHREPLPGK